MAHLPFPRIPPGRCPGHWGPGVGRCTPHHQSPGSGSRYSASCVGVARCWARTPARAAGTAGRGARPWLSATDWHRGSGRCWAWTGAGVDPALSPWAAKFQFRFPQDPSLFPAEPFPRPLLAAFPAAIRQVSRSSPASPGPWAPEALVCPLLRGCGQRVGGGVRTRPGRCGSQRKFILSS